MNGYQKQKEKKMNTKGMKQNRQQNRTLLKKACVLALAVAMTITPCAPAKAATPVYDKVSEFKDGIAYVDKDGILGYINTDGKLISLGDYSMVKEFKEGMAKVAVGDDWRLRRYGYVDKTGKEVIACQYDIEW